MIIEQRIKEFENLGFGMFVHFGLYSVLAKGEWARHHVDIAPEEYDKLFYEFKPERDWAKKLVATAKAAGCKYITLTTRHHDGYSLYDTCGLNEFDAPHAMGRDLVREFVDECRAQGIIPFFYHTLLDWHEPSYNTDFKAYLKYLRASVEILCKNYGKIGGLWFDGKWNKPNDDWEEDELYALIRSYQPDAMIINNTGLDARGALGHIELDSVTFERGKPQPINLDDSPKYIASEMCQTIGCHWGYAKRDYNFKSLVELIEDICVCRRYGANYLLNVGPMGNGYLRPLDEALLSALGDWVDIQKEALYLPKPTGIEIADRKDDFILKGDDKTYYLFHHGLPTGGDHNVVIGALSDLTLIDRFELDGKVKAIHWIDDGASVDFEQDGKNVTFKPVNQPYGFNMVVKIAKIEVE